MSANHRRIPSNKYFASPPSVLLRKESRNKTSNVKDQGKPRSVPTPSHFDISYQLLPPTAFMQRRDGTPLVESSSDKLRRRNRSGDAESLPVAETRQSSVDRPERWCLAADQPRHMASNAAVTLSPTADGLKIGPSTPVRQRSRPGANCDATELVDIRKILQEVSTNKDKLRLKMSRFCCFLLYGFMSL